MTGHGVLAELGQARAGSPGVRWMSTKMMTVTSSATGAISASRRRM